MVPQITGTKAGLNLIKSLYKKKKTTAMQPPPTRKSKIDSKDPLLRDTIEKLISTIYMIPKGILIFQFIVIELIQMTIESAPITLLTYDDIEL